MLTKPLYEDPVVAEIHAVRQKLLAECDGDIRKLSLHARDRMRAFGRSVRPAPPTPPVTFQDRTNMDDSGLVAKSHVQ